MIRCLTYQIRSSPRQPEVVRRTRLIGWASRVIRSHFILKCFNRITHQATFRAVLNEDTSGVFSPPPGGVGREGRMEEGGRGDWSHRVLYDPSHTVIVHLSTKEHEIRVCAGMGDWSGFSAFPRGDRRHGGFSEFTEEPVESSEPRNGKKKNC